MWQMREFTSGAYFGCWGHMGHFLYDVKGSKISLEETNLPWKSEELDGRLCPGYSRKPQQQLQFEGEAIVHYRDGWTALAFWDRSFDTRYGSNSVFLLPGIFTIDEAIVLAQKTFPTIWKRFTFPVRATATAGSL
jgi:hypothetical protein